ncbi:MAG: SAM-dependent methyltransferase [Candidatus Dormibacteria bacterium]
MTALAGEGALSLIESGHVLVDGVPVRSPRSQLRQGARVSLRGQPSLRGSVKLAAALSAFGIAVQGRVALDVGAAAGGFTTVLLAAGAQRVYAVDAGFGQLLGSLRQDPRVVDLERHNLGDLDTAVVPEAVEMVSIDVSYLSLREAVRQLGRLEIAPGADLVGLVKPMFELGQASAPADRASLDAALQLAREGVEASGWEVRGTMDSPVTGARGAPEMLLWGSRR